MTTETATQDAEPDATTGSERDRSTIGFPYGDLDDALKVARAVHDVGGTSCQIDQLVAKLGGVSDKSGAFRQKTLAAKTFGLTTSSQGTVRLTPLGQRIVDPQQVHSAKVEAFLTVPLYKAIYEKFSGTKLPPAQGLEEEMVRMGVAPKQKDKARQVFQRAAEQAGFFSFGQDRLVRPGKSGGQNPNPAGDGPDPNAKTKDANGGGSGGEGGGHHPFIQGLLRTLPPAETEWTREERRKWLMAAATIFELIYTDANAHSGTITVEVKRVAAAQGSA